MLSKCCVVLYRSPSPSCTSNFSYASAKENSNAIRAMLIRKNAKKLIFKMDFILLPMETRIVIRTIGDMAITMRRLRLKVSDSLHSGQCQLLGFGEKSAVLT